METKAFFRNLADFRKDLTRSLRSLVPGEIQKGSTWQNQEQSRLRLLFATARSLLASLAPQRQHRAEPGVITLAVAIRNRSLPARFARTIKAAPG